MTLFRNFILLFSLLLFMEWRQGSESKASRFILQMFDSIKNIRTLQMKISAIERGEKNFITARSEIKLQNNPHKLYFINRHKKTEILYDAEHNSKTALVKTHGFPYMSLPLDPNGSLMKKNQHYTILDIGFTFLSKAIALTISKDKDGLNSFWWKGKILKNNIPCLMIEYESTNFSYHPYTLVQKETVSALAARLGVNEFILRYKNSLINHFDLLAKGTTLHVPNLYCKKAIIYLSEKSMLPVSVSLYDDSGLFESYDFSDVKINVPFKAGEFSRNNPEYGF